MRQALGFLLLAALGAGCGSFDDESEAGAGSACPDDGSGYDLSAQGNECQVLELVNQLRASGATCSGTPRGSVPALTMNALLRQSARGHASDMAKNDYFSHDSQDGRSFTDRISAAGYRFSAAAENIAAGSETAEQALQQWLESTAGHCENIMSPRYVEIGVGYAQNPGTRLQHYWVQNFGAPR
jgi:uncharacterized protein YkwD